MAADDRDALIQAMHESCGQLIVGCAATNQDIGLVIERLCVRLCQFKVLLSADDSGQIFHIMRLYQTAGIT